MIVFEAITFWHWMTLGGLLVIAEAFAPGFMLLWLGLAAATVGVILTIWPGLDLPFQLLAFAALSVASVIAWRQFGFDRTPASDHPTLNQRGAAYLGRRATLVDPIVNGFGRIKLGDASWSVTGPDLPAGRVVEIVGGSGVVLHVEPVEAPGSPEPPLRSPEDEGMVAPSAEAGPPAEGEDLSDQEAGEERARDR